MPPEPQITTATGKGPDEISGFERALESLTHGADLRVWSVIVTLFGDLARNPGDQISGACLGQLTDLMGIKPQAMRVALHRLRKDGWISSEKTGRTSKYQLTKSGLEQSQTAGARIYAQHATNPDSFQILVAQPMPVANRTMLDQTLARHGHVVIAPGVYLGAATSGPQPEECFMVQGAAGSVPDWLRTMLAPEMIAQGYAQLETTLHEVTAILDDKANLTPAEVATLRTLIVHSWRRLLLRHADLPDSFFPANWRGPQCRVLLANLLDHLKRPELAGLSP